MELDRVIQFCHTFSSLITAESLSTLIRNAAYMGAITGLKMIINLPPLTHVLFADNVMLFVEATTMNAYELSKILNLYSRASGQQINIAKSGIIFNKGCSS